MFLRSFHNPQAVQVFGEVIAPVASRFAPVVGLCSERQQPGDFHVVTEANVHGVFRRVPDAHWRTWVEQHLHACTAAIIDVSVQTTSVSWELEQAIATVGGPFTVVLADADAAAGEATPGVETIRYSMANRAGRRAARRALRAWFAHTRDRMQRGP